MNIHMRSCCVALLLSTLAVGCQTPPNHTDQGALLGGLGGAGLGAIIGSQTHHAAAGAAIGAIAGTATGALVGNQMDQNEARNRAMIEQRLGRQVRPGAVTLDEVIAMSSAGVGDELIVNHVRAHGLIAPLATNDIIRLKQSGVSDRVVQSLQNMPPAGVVVAPPPPPQTVIVEQPYYYHRPYNPYPYGYYRRPGVTVGVGL